MSREGENLCGFILIAPAPASAPVLVESWQNLEGAKGEDDGGFPLWL